jgi:hypothetical protein
MARKLKIYQTSLGLFDQAIAAPSMKAALEACGADSNLFHQGAAKESDDPAVIAATMAKPGILSSDQSDPTDPLANMQNCQPTWAAVDDQPNPPASRYVKSRRRLSQSPSTRLQRRKPLSPTKGSRSAVMIYRKRKRPPDKRSGSGAG